MNRLRRRAHFGVSDSVARLLLGLGFVLPVFPPAPARAREAGPDHAAAASLPAWSWVEHCHVQRGHQLTDWGTSASLVTAARNQIILSSPDAGKNRPGASFLGTLRQDLWSGGALIAYAEGGTAQTLDPVIGDSLGTDGLAQPAAGYLSHLFVLQDMADRHVQLALGRIVTSDFFDTNRVANCEFVQFLSASLVNNPTIPFPQAGLGAAARLAPAHWLYVQAAAADAAARATRADFDTALRTRDNTFGVLEFGLSLFSPEHAGAYRFLLWHNPPGGWSGPGRPHDNHGFAVSFDQPAADHLTFFFRYGWAQAPVNQLTEFVSAGALLKRPLPGRDHDSLRGAVAWGNAAGRDETLLEVDYSLHVTDSLTFTPLVQISIDPVNHPRDDTFVVAGLRAVYVF